MGIFSSYLKPVDVEKIKSVDDVKMAMSLIIKRFLNNLEIEMRNSTADYLKLEAGDKFHFEATRQDMYIRVGEIKIYEKNASDIIDELLLNVLFSVIEKEIYLLSPDISE